LRYLVAVAEAGTFTHAAERLFVTQPTLSQQIVALAWPGVTVLVLVILFAAERREYGWQRGPRARSKKRS
jgi:hypothetical protein